MESRINYTLVGLFVLLLTAGLTYFVYWLGTHGGSEEYDCYRVYMSESVAGLSADASVKYMGVSVGTVEHIGINPVNPKQVELILKIRRGTPVTEDTTAQLKFFGITGLAFIELKGDGSDSPLMKPGEGSMPVIPSKPSTLKRMDEALSLLASRSATALERIANLLSDKNLENFTVLLVETRFLAAEMQTAIQRFKMLIDQTSITEDRLVETAGKVKVASEQVRKMAQRLGTVYGEAGTAVTRDIHQSLELMNQLIMRLDMLAGETQRAVRRLEESPGDLLFRRTVPRPGPGEPGYIDENRDENKTTN